MTPAPAATRDDTRVVGLVRRLGEEITTLFTKELALLKAETTSAIKDTRSGIGAMAVGGAVLYAGLLFLLTSAMLGLALVMDAWLAALIVGGVVAIIGAIMLASGKRKLEPSAFKPEHTAASLEKDRDMIKRNIHESHDR
ncbi:MAG: phage holin family protein [Gammaproteobacteria bacterium]|nr:phage holin family protein [Gammaproteobacteria bacterium]